MNAKERVKAALRFQEVDRIPATIFDNGVWLTGRRNMSLQDLLDQKDGGAEILLEVFKETGTDIAWVANGCHSYCLKALGADSDYKGVGAPGENPPLFADITDVEKYSADAIRETLLADSGIQALIAQARAVKEAIGEEMYLATVLAAPFTYAGMLLGVQSLMEAIADEDDNLPALFAYAKRLTVEYAKLFIENGVDLICLGDPVASGDLISQGMFEEYALPLEKEALEEISDAAFRMVHICGNTLARLESLKTLPIDGFSLDSVDLKTAMEIADGHYAIFGNVNPFAVVESKSVDEITEIAVDLCKTAGKKGGFVLMPGCDTTAGTPLENLAALIAAPQRA